MGRIESETSIPHARFGLGAESKRVVESLKNKSRASAARDQFHS